MNAKSLGIFALGSLFGALVGVIAVKKYYQKRSDDEIEEIKRVYTWKKPEFEDISPKNSEKTAKNVAEMHALNTERHDKGVEATPGEVKLYEKELKDERINKNSSETRLNKTDYSIYASSYAQDDDPKDENDGLDTKEIDPAELEHPVDEDSESDGPYEIEAEEAGYGRTCVSATYFVNNNVLVEGNSLEEIDIDESIGKENLEKCLEKWEDYPDDPLYFRNEQLGLDYEVLRSEENYTELARAWNGIEN